MRDSHSRRVDADVHRDGVRGVDARTRSTIAVGVGESPLLRARISRDLDEAVHKAADTAGASRLEWVPRALDEATHRAA